MPGDYNFDEAVGFLFQLEGFEADDTGGPTMFGITEKRHPEVYARMKETETIKEKMDIARDCYFTEYWQPVTLLTGYRGMPEHNNVKDPLVIFQKVAFLQFVNIHRDTITRIIQEAKGKLLKKADYVLWESLVKYYGLAADKKYNSQFRGWIGRVLRIAKHYEIK